MRSSTPSLSNLSSHDIYCFWQLASVACLLSLPLSCCCNMNQHLTFLWSSQLDRGHTPASTLMCSWKMFGLLCWFACWGDAGHTSDSQPLAKLLLAGIVLKTTDLGIACRAMIKDVALPVHHT
jgi:hypothetical protein